MKAITIENKTLAVIEIRGAFVYYTNDKNQIKSIELSKVNVVEVQENEIFKPKYSYNKTKKINRANIMSKADLEAYNNSKYANMSNDDYLEMRRNAAFNSKSW